MGGVYHQRVFRNVLPSPLATNAGLRIARTPCVRGPQACTPAHGSACVHVPCADMHAREHAWTWLVLTCTGHVQVCIAACRLRDSLVGLRFVQESLPSSVLNPPPVQNSLESPGLVYIMCTLRHCRPCLNFLPFRPIRR